METARIGPEKKKPQPHHHEGAAASFKSTTVTTLPQAIPDGKRGRTPDSPSTQSSTLATGATVSDSAAGDPWSPAAVARRGLSALRDLAQALHQRRRPPIEILLALHEHGRLLASAQGYRLHGMLPVVRELPGLERWDPDAEAERVEAEWRRRAEALADWLRSHTGEALAERICRAAEPEAAEVIIAAEQNDGLEGSV